MQIKLKPFEIWTQKYIIRVNLKFRYIHFKGEITNIKRKEIDIFLFIKILKSEYGKLFDFLILKTCDLIYFVFNTRVKLLIKSCLQMGFFLFQ